MMERLLEAERLLLMGLLDQAEAVYRRVATEEPRNAVAVTGLSRVALDRGDDRRAYELAREALERDPEDVMALRLEARLSEILAARGEAVSRPAGVLLDATPAGAGDGGRPEASGRGLLRRLTGR